jgi:uncharacterized protein YjbI with pentapeptide repeats
MLLTRVCTWALVTGLIGWGAIAPGHSQGNWLQKKACVGCDLRFLNLSGLDLTGFDLRRANLQGADLTNTVLFGANLSQADCRRANLSQAVLSRANLSGANFEGADLTNATLYRAKAQEPFNLTNARLDNTQMPTGQIVGAAPAPKPPE